MGHVKVSLNSADAATLQLVVASLMLLQVLSEVVFGDEAKQLLDLLVEHSGWVFGQNVSKLMLSGDIHRCNLARLDVLLVEEMLQSNMLGAR